MANAIQNSMANVTFLRLMLKKVVEAQETQIMLPLITDQSDEKATWKVLNSLLETT